MFHVSTRMPLATDNTGFNRKVRRQFYYQYTLVYEYSFSQIPSLWKLARLIALFCNGKLGVRAGCLSR